jgi:L-alanine-DL-glutamate epimerase-like enolase superfamily enzyme
MGYTVFYVKVGIDFGAELRMVEALRGAIGPERKIRIDANGSWTLDQAVRYLAEFDRYRIDFAEQPVWPDPARNMAELRRRTSVPLSANEGLWRVNDVYKVIVHHAADVLCFSSNLVGTLSQFHRLSHMAHLEGLRVCRHTHGELGIMAAASHHVCLTLPNLVDGNQQTAEMMEDDVLTGAVPTASGPTWGIPKGTGLCVDVDEEKVEKYNRLYEKQGQFLPYQPSMFERETDQ